MKLVKDIDIKTTKELIKERRFMFVGLSAQQLLQIISMDKAIHFHCDGLPKDAVYLGMGYKIEMDMLYMKVASKEFEPVPEACVIPIFENLMIQAKECECNK